MKVLEFISNNAIYLYLMLFVALIAVFVILIKQLNKIKQNLNITKNSLNNIQNNLDNLQNKKEQIEELNSQSWPYFRNIFIGWLILRGSFKDYLETRKEKRSIIKSIKKNLKMH